MKWGLLTTTTTTTTTTSDWNRTKKRRSVYKWYTGRLFRSEKHSPSLSLSLTSSKQYGLHQVSLGSVTPHWATMNASLSHLSPEIDRYEKNSLGVGKNRRKGRFPHLSLSLSFFYKRLWKNNFDQNKGERISINVDVLLSSSIKS